MGRITGFLHRNNLDVGFVHMRTFSIVLYDAEVSLFSCVSVCGASLAGKRIIFGGLAILRCCALNTTYVDEENLGCRMAVSKQDKNRTVLILFVLIFSGGLFLFANRVVACLRLFVLLVVSP